MKNIDENLAAALATGVSIREAAEQCGMSERTAYRRRQAPEFMARVTKLRDDMISEALGRLADSMSEAAVALRDLLKTESIRLSAARSLLEFGIKVRDDVEIVARIQALEEREKS